MAILPKATYKSSAMSIKIPTKIFTDLKRVILNFIWKNKNSRIAKIILYSKGTSGGITISDFKLHYRATVLKQPGTGIKTDRRTYGTESKTRILIHTSSNTLFLKQK